ncbi:hypothetical protein [Rhizobium alvei]|uniref:Transmembrane protein n=1 Tax=Rhizobium alvei TaxID=1132659 RepID=A0ABT8YQE5_9HYPH|nr:hypothetical protein [Rhizobium alvei]MDO6965410.1 hypothetical protein [Rhizobium alvei]
MMKPLIHASAGSIALALVSLFMLSTVASELLLDHAAILLVKTTIIYTMPLLIVTMAVTGGSGASLYKGRTGGITEAKKSRMKLIAINGVCVMVPSALVLYYWATLEKYDSGFYLLQVIELIGGMTQFTLLGLNFRDGRKMTARRRQLARTNKAQ